MESRLDPGHSPRDQSVRNAGIDILSERLLAFAGPDRLVAAIRFMVLNICLDLGMQAVGIRFVLILNGSNDSILGRSNTRHTESHAQDNGPICGQQHNDP